MSFLTKTYCYDEYAAHLEGMDSLLTYAKNHAVDGRIDIAALESGVPILHKTAQKKIGKLDLDECQTICEDIKTSRALLARSISKSMLRNIERAFVSYGLVCARQMKFDRIYTAIGLTCFYQQHLDRDATLGFMHYFEDICSRVSNDESEWDACMEDLLDKLGIVNQSGEIDLPKYIREYTPEDVILCEESESDKQLGRTEQ